MVAEERCSWEGFFPPLGLAVSGSRRIAAVYPPWRAPSTLMQRPAGAYRLGDRKDLQSVSRLCAQVVPHRFAAAFLAISDRRSELSFAARAGPPFRPP